MSSNDLPLGFDGPRACGRYDLAPLLDNANLVMRVLGAGPGRPTVGFDWSHIYNHSNLDNIRLISYKGRVISSIAIFPSEVRTPAGTISVGGINCFATHPDYRRRGLGELVLLDAHRKMRSNGHHIGLLTTRIEDYYRRFHWEYGGWRLEFFLDRGNIDFLPEIRNLNVTEDWFQYLPEMKELHNEESIAADRSEELFELLLQRKCERVFVAVLGGKAVAYAAYVNGFIREYGGNTDYAAALVRAVFHKIDDLKTSASTYKPGEDPTFSMKLIAPDTTLGLSGMLSNLGIQRSMESIGMVRILDLPGLLKSLNLGEVETERREHGWRLHRGSATLDVTEREAVKLVFGPERYPDFSPDLFPVDFFQWPMDIV